MFVVMRDIKRMNPTDLASDLSRRLENDSEIFSSNDRLSVHQQNRKYLHRILARMTYYIEKEVYNEPIARYLELNKSTGKQRIEVEHIWANKPERHEDEFTHPNDFLAHRNRFGGLLLLPRPFNASYGALPYDEKLPHYFGQNLLARSLSPLAYEHDPDFKDFIERSGLPFRYHKQFTKVDLEERYNLYLQIAEQIWDPTKLNVNSIS